MLSPTLADLTAPLIRVLRAFTRPKGVLLIPPAGPGSLGDEAMVEGLAQRLTEAGDGPVHLLARAGEEPWPRLRGVDHFDTVPQGAVARAVCVLRQMLGRSRVMVIGADCLDGHYSVPASLFLIHSAYFANACGIRATIVGSSYKPGAAPETASAIGKIPASAVVCSRDPVSRDRMASASGRDVRLVADAAFMLKPDPDAVPQDAAGFLDSQIAAGRKVIGVNFNRQVLPEGTGQREALLDAYAAALATLADDPDLAVLLIPHDYRNQPSDADHANTLAQRLSDAWGDRVHACQGRLTPGAVKAIVDRLHIALTGRMHMAIACLGRGTPPACVAYQGKFEGLMRHFGISDMTLDPEHAIDPSQLAQLVRSVLERSEQLRDQIQARHDGILEMSLQNLEHPGLTSTHAGQAQHSHG